MKVALVLIAVLLAVGCVYTTQKWSDAEARISTAESRASIHQGAYEAQLSEIAELTRSFVVTDSQLSGCEEAYSELAAQYAEQVKASQEARFEFYYSPAVVHRVGLDELKGYLELFDWIPQFYSEGYFDCSEIAAYMEWALENAGFHTVLLCGDSPTGGGRHAWLLVEAGENRYMPVEATIPKVVLWDDKHFDDYFARDYSYDDITQAITAGRTEFDWWVNWESWTQ